MYFFKEMLVINFCFGGYWSELWVNCNMWNLQNDFIIVVNCVMMMFDMLVCNVVGGFFCDFWVEIDNQVLQLWDQEVGMEIVNDLIGVQIVLLVGKIVKLYNVVGDIVDDVLVSIDGQVLFFFDYIDYVSDGDLILVFIVGYGVNWCYVVGFNFVGIDLVLDLQMVKMCKFNQKCVNYYLNGDLKIQVQFYLVQGIKNYCNIKKINFGFGVGGVNIDLISVIMI